MTLALTASQTNAARTAFTDHYFVSSTGDSSFSSQFDVSWDDFLYSVQDLMTNIGATEEDLVLQFFHRYNADTQSWFLTMGGSIMGDVLRRIGNNDVYRVTPGTYRYDLSADGIYSSDFEGNAAPDYFNNFYYKTGPETYSALSSDTLHTTYVSSVSICWLKEIYQLYLDNNPSPGSTVRLVFASVSFDCPQPDPYSNVEWPHTICLYLNIDGNDALDNSPTPSGVLFKMRAADAGTTCPPMIGVYVMPAALNVNQEVNPGSE